MLCLLRSQAVKRGLAAVWFGCISAGLLATSSPYGEWDGANTAIEFERSGPPVRLSDADSARAFRVIVLVPKPEGEAWVAPWYATVYLEFLLDHTPDTATPEGPAPWWLGLAARGTAIFNDDDGKAQTRALVGGLVGTATFF